MCDIDFEIPEEQNAASVLYFGDLECKNILVSNKGSPKAKAFNVEEEQENSNQDFRVLNSIPEILEKSGHCILTKWASTHDRREVYKCSHAKKFYPKNVELDS